MPENEHECKVTVEANPTYGLVILRFNRPSSWLSMNKLQARNLLKPLQAVLEDLGAQDIYPRYTAQEEGSIPDSGAKYTVVDGDFRLDFAHNYDWVRMDVNSLKRLVDALTSYVNDGTIRHLKAVQA